MIFFYPFSPLRLHQVPDKLRITRDLHDAIATAMEDLTLDYGGRALVGLGVCLWAIGELESELVAMRGEPRVGWRLREVQKGEWRRQEHTRTWQDGHPHSSTGAAKLIKPLPILDGCTPVVIV